MRLLQLSDPHVRVPGDPLSGRVDTLPYLERAAEAVAKFQPRPDVVLITGDLIDTLVIEEYRHAAKALSRIDLPLFVLPGNHDYRDGMREVLGQYLRPQPIPDRIAYVV